MLAKQLPNATRRALIIGSAIIATGAVRLVHAQANSMKIGIIGTGKIGGALAEHWAKAGHELVISSRHPDHLKALAERLGPKELRQALKLAP